MKKRREREFKASTTLTMDAGLEIRKN